MAFAAAVEEAGHQWPTNADGIPWVKGRGYVDGAPSGADAHHAGPAQEEAFAQVADSVFAYQTRMMSWVT